MNVGLLVDQKMSQWAVEAVERMLEKTCAQITLVIVNDGGRAIKDPECSRIAQLYDHLKHGIEDGLWGVSRKVAYTIGGTPWYEVPTPVDSIEYDSNPTVRYCEPHPVEPYGIELPDSEVDAIRRETDVVVRFGFGIVKGDVLDASDHGVLSYHHGDIRRFRGRPAGFWEFLAEEPNAGVTLQRLNEELDGGEIVKFQHVEISDLYTWQAVRERLFTVSLDMLAAAVADLENDEIRPTTPDSLGELYSVPASRDTVRYLWKNNVGRIKRLYDQY